MKNMNDVGAMKPSMGKVPGGCCAVKKEWDILVSVVQSGWSSVTDFLQRVFSNISESETYYMNGAYGHAVAIVTVVSTLCLCYVYYSRYYKSNLRSERSNVGVELTNTKISGDRTGYTAVGLEEMM